MLNAAVLICIIPSDVSTKKHLYAERQFNIINLVPLKNSDLKVAKEIKKI